MEIQVLLGWPGILLGSFTLLVVIIVLAIPLLMVPRFRRAVMEKVSKYNEEEFGERPKDQGK